MAFEGKEGYPPLAVQQEGNVSKLPSLLFPVLADLSLAIHGSFFFRLVPNSVGRIERDRSINSWAFVVALEHRANSVESLAATPHNSDHRVDHPFACEDVSFSRPLESRTYLLP